MNSFFLDGSGLAKRYVAEPGTPLLDSLLDNVSSDRLVVLNIGFAEVVSILVRRKNAGVLSSATFAQALLHVGQEIIHAPTLHKVWNPRTRSSLRLSRTSKPTPSMPPTPSSCMPR
jgi:hypothetical protein